MARLTTEVDGHMFVLTQIAGITKVLLGQPNEQGQRLVFFDVLTKGQATLRVGRESSIPHQGKSDLDEVIALLDQWRADLGNAVTECIEAEQIYMPAE